MTKKNKLTTKSAGDSNGVDEYIKSLSDVSPSSLFVDGLGLLREIIQSEGSKRNEVGDVWTEVFKHQHPLYSYNNRDVCYIFGRLLFSVIHVPLLHLYFLIDRHEETQRNQIRLL